MAQEIKIVELKADNKSWKIKARIENKTPIQIFRKGGNEVKVFDVDVLDDTGKIRCTAYGDNDDKFHNIIQVSSKKIPKIHKTNCQEDNS
ncbi:hypothetical protein HCN44_000329 [Aphidius gifuensis]|uniref:Uncharacterized protein n=1 Tax=Aphidius gifuensis TaxID=684658 RepID=A0A835CN70_APHGI|nr:hypothetical protein HCN44_000329 [Aphidius gifuensis]